MLLGDNLVDFAEFSKTSETERDQKIRGITKKSLVRNSSFSLTQCTDHGKALFTMVINWMPRVKLKSAKKNLQGFDK